MSTHNLCYLWRINKIYPSINKAVEVVEDEFHYLMKWLVFQLRHEKTNDLHMRKQRRRSASR